MTRPTARREPYMVMTIRVPEEVSRILEGLAYGKRISLSEYVRHVMIDHAEVLKRRRSKT